jgi:hypothetical protein
MTGVRLDFDTCLSINDRDVVNTLKIVEDNFIIFTCGATVVIKDVSHMNTQTIVAKKGLLRSVTALDAYVQDKTKKIALVIGESSSTEKSSILIHHCVAGEEQSWTTLSTQNIFGDVKQVHINPVYDKKTERKHILALIQNQDEGKQQRVFLWNFLTDTKQLEQLLSIILDDISFIPGNSRKVISDYLSFSCSVTRT